MSDKGLISMVEREHINSLLIHGKRIDGRNFDEYRTITAIPNFVPKAEGSAIVKIGRTKVIAGVKASIGEPFEDTPEEGVVTATVELIPLASPDFESGPPREDAIELARVTDRAIRESKCVSQDSLVIIPGKKVWILFIDIYVLDNDGNLFDACELAALTALMHTQLPECKIITNEDGIEDVEVLETKKPIQLDHIPISNTFAKIGTNIIIDPLLKEESIADARLTLSFTEENKICATQKGGSGSFTIDEIKKCIDIASERTKEIRSKLNSIINPEGYPWSEER
ncbi:RNA-binding protein [Candidatus Heimdallarchaeota archaeon]|nr:MAG: RNA-binding protein [Candidatus Heimdallarchaeota archaeon]RLI72788.1 MAG: RNA-binding protein [Candidatus Gerdarchaeota archaeon]